MNYKVRSIDLSATALQRYSIISSDSPPRLLTPLSKVNLFVGANNNGKSFFLRGLPAIKNLAYVPQMDVAAGYKIAEDVRKRVHLVLHRNNCSEINNFMALANALRSDGLSTEGEPFLNSLRVLLTNLGNIPGNQLNVLRGTSSSIGDNPKIRGELKAIAEEFLPPLNRLTGTEEITFRRVYIPTLRSLRILDPGKDHYEVRTREEYFKATTAEEISIFTGQNLYNRLEALILGSLDEREKLRAFQLFLGERFFQGRPVTLTPNRKEKTIFVKLGNEQERAIHELGDGIQSIIILTFPAFEHSAENLLLFAEEPELFLHPGLQRALLESLMFYPDFKNAQFFFATHSNHMLDLTLDVEQISVFTFHKLLKDPSARQAEASFTVENVSSDDRRTLRLLEIQNSSVFLANCTIWVEGITDRLYFLHLLQILAKDLEAPDFKLDLHYSFVEYGGSNITHWSFLDDDDQRINLDSLCGRFFLITDSDNAQGEKETRLAKLKVKLGERFYCHSCRELENLIPPKILLEVVGEYEGKPVENAEGLKYEDYKDKPIAVFIEETLLAGKKERQGSYRKKNSSMLEGKGSFMERVISATKDASDVSEEGKTIARKLINFIKENNPAVGLPR